MVIVFFHAVITVENETIFPKAEKYPFTISCNQKRRQLTGEKILKQYRNAVAVIIAPSHPSTGRERETEKQKKEAKKSKRQREREYVSYLSIYPINQYLYINLDIPRGGQMP